MKLRLTGMAAGLAIGTTAAVVIACGLGTYLYSHHHFQTILETSRTTALMQSEMIRAALEHQMMENDRSLIAQMIDSFGREKSVRAVVLLDRQGHAHYSSAALESLSDLTIGSPTCQSCHRYPPEQRGSSRVIETSGGTVLRTVTPFRNQERCHRCHDPSHKINGILIVDTDVGEIRAGMNRDLRWLAGGSGLLMLILITAIGLIVRVFVMRRLQRFETTARLIAAGDFDRRVPAGGSDTVSWLAREFNSMADSMSGLLGEVREQRERLEKVINSIDDGIVVLDTERRVIAANDAFLRRSGLPRGDLLGSSCRHIAQGMCGLVDCPTLACLRTGERQVRICERRPDDGEVRWEEVHSSPVVAPGGGIVQVVEVWRDISDRRAAEARLAESHRLASLGMLASGFSHEMNTPLATALTSVEGILRSIKSEDAGKADDQGERDDEAERDDQAERDHVAENARIAREQLLRCGGITRHFLQLASGKPSLASLVDIEPAIQAVARLLAPMAEAQSVSIEVEAIPPGTRVRVSDAELQHVLMNLIVNGIQACGARGRVRVGVTGGDPVTIRVSDDGCGIAPEVQRRIFEPFFSARSGGTGLGLFLSLSIARKWGGDVRVRSAPGSGSTFEIALPAAGSGVD